MLQSGDIETNPGPFPTLPSLPSFEKKEDPLVTLQGVVDERLRFAEIFQNNHCLKPVKISHSFFSLFQSTQGIGGKTIRFDS